MKIALAQILSTEAPEENLRQVAANATTAAAQGAEIVVFPEATMCAFGNDISEIAEPLTGEWAKGIKALASKLGIVIVVGMFVPGDNGKVQNTLVIAQEDSV